MKFLKKRIFLCAMIHSGKQYKTVLKYPILLFSCFTISYHKTEENCPSGHKKKNFMLYHKPRLKGSSNYMSDSSSSNLPFTAKPLPSLLFRP